MDQRQQQIRERAGLEESRLNQDFIQFLQKFGTPILFCIAAVAAGYALFQRYQKSEETKVAAAWAEYAAATTGINPSPDALIALADTHASRGAVPIRARLDAADVYLESVRRGVKPGAVVNADGSLASADDAINNASERDELLGQAAASYQWVLDKTQANSKQAIFSIEALYGLAAVAESKGSWEDAKGFLQRVIEMSKASGFAGQAEVAQARIASMGPLATLEPVPLKAQVPAPYKPAPPAPVVVPAPVGATSAPASALPAMPEVKAPATNPPAQPEAPKQPATTPAPGGG